MRYNEFRPKLFQDIVGQLDTTKVLQQSVLNQNIPHSLLFCGPSGTGKTTTARIVAATLCCENPINGEPCNQCHSCEMSANNNHWDILEINAADLRGIDGMRDLTYKAYLSPFGKAKVVILDEAHMLTKEAMNCLLKLLEEPPPLLTLILCTSEPGSLLMTLKSRCMIFEFKPLPEECIKERITRICQALSFNPMPAWLNFVAHESEGNMRTSLNMLERVVTLQKVESNK